MANTVEIHVRAQDSASRVLGGVGRAFKNVASNVAASLGTLAKGATSIAAIGTTAVSVVPLLAPAVKAMVGVGQAALQASPALLSFAAAGVFVGATLRKIFAEGSAMRKAIEPLGKAFDDAGEAASNAAAKGVRPLIEEFNRVNFPSIRAAMVRIGEATNKVTTGFLKWANSAAGVRAIRGIVEPIGKAMNDLAPSITRAAISFTDMLGRITGVSMAAGTSGLSGILDKLSDKMDRVNKTSVGGGLSKLGDTARKVAGFVRTLARWIGRAVDLYKTYQTKFGLVADAIAVVAIAFGGPVTAIIAGIGLIVRHFDKLKAAYNSVKDYFKSPIGKGVLDDLKSAAETIIPKIKEAFENIKREVLPALEDLGETLKNDLGPAFADFAKEAAPVVGWLIEHLGKDMANKLAGTIKIIDGLATSLSGFFTMMSGLLSGDFGKFFDGLKKHWEGLGKIVKGVMRNLAGEHWDDFVANLNKAKDAVTGLIDRMKGLKDKTVRIAQQGAEKAKDAVQSVIATIRRYVGKVVNIGERGAGKAKGAIDSLIGTIRRLAGKIVSIGERGAAAAMRRVNDLINAIRRLVGKVVRVGANVFGTGAVRGLADAISRVTSKVVNVGARVFGGIFGRAHGGIVGAANGGLRSGLTMVGEHGRELLELPPGTRVRSNPDTERMLAQGGGGGVAKLVWGDGPTDPLARAIWEWLKENIRIEGGGGDDNVQRALG